MGNTPTMEEHYSMKEQVTELHSQNILLTERLREKEDKIMAQIDELRDKVLYIYLLYHSFLFFLFVGNNVKRNVYKYSRSKAR